jgi:DNA ligase-associated metallophosphoesterase
MKIAVLGQTLELLSDRALFWHEEKMLIFSDVHLGKAESLQREGVAIPAESGFSDFHRINHLIHHTQPKEIIILGDLIHSRKSWSVSLKEQLLQFLNSHSSIAVSLVVGNHERGSLPILQKLPLQLLGDGAVRGPFQLAHGDQKASARTFQISGHVHPVVVLRDGPLKMTWPCFVLSRKRLLLPSFGTWTGGFKVRRTPAHRYFAATGTETFEIE